MKKKPPGQHALGAWPFVLFVALLMLLLGGLHQLSTRPPRTLPAPVAAPPKAREKAAKKPRSEARSRGPGAARGCTPDAFQRCHQGDVWSEDSCARLERKIEECGVQLCREGACDEPDPEPCSDPSEGRCDGASVRLCHAGRAQRIDCAAKGMRCRQGEEGAECAPVLTREQRCAGGARCEGDVLVECIEGERRTRDCRVQGALCTSLPGATAPQCVKLMPAAPVLGACDACGCAASAQGERSCDGRDEDGDALVDEGLDCGPIPLRVVVVADASGYSSFARDEIEAEIAQLGRRLSDAETDTPLHFELGEFVVLQEPSWLEMDNEEVQRAALDPRLHPAQSRFYVPVLFTDLLFADGQVPRSGASTLPNGFCGGSQRGVGADVGLVAIAKARSPTTLLHELGHFFGLCHTHELSPGLGSAAGEPSAGLRACRPECTTEGDGMCDTPLDPGPERCVYDAACQALCSGGARPDTENLMSYYTVCRRHFSPEQTRLIEHTLALRRAWQPCLTEGCRCAFGAHDCPFGMACRPAAADLTQGGRCALLGARAPGVSCQTHAQCDGESLCLAANSDSGHCMRVCSASAPGCACVGTNLGVSVCREDMGAAR